MPSTCLSSFPVETLENIASRTAPLDLLALRFTCREIESKLRALFGKTFFSNKRFWRNNISLRTLNHIAESRLASFIKTVTIGTELLPYGSGTVADLISAADQNNYLASGIPGHLLTSAFRKLPNIETVAVTAFNVSAFLTTTARQTISWPADWEEHIFNGSNPLAGWGFRSLAKS